MRKPKAKATVVLSTRVSVAMAARLDWLVRNHGSVEDRTEALRSAIRAWVEIREKETVQAGLSPPAF
jgi:Arc/MetJ-type ribon-helix-helix transcriptional regulator